MKRLILLLALPLLLSVFISCDKDDDEPDPNVTFKATLTGSQEAPNPNASTATGTATLVFNKTTKVFTLTVTHNITSPTNGHIHKGAIGASGPPVFAFTSFTSPISYTSTALDASQEADLYAGLYYVNIHTSTYPGGEIRGQLIQQ
jgi:hypothetical protein